MERAPIERILCPVDFSEFSARACDYAFSLASHYKARLFVQHVVELWRHPSASFATTAVQYGDFCDTCVADARERLQDFLKDRETSGVCAERVVQKGLAIDSILSMAQREAVQLIVMGTHGARGLDRLMLGSVTDRVLRHAPCSVLAVHRATKAPAISDAGNGLDLREIIFCTDFSDHANSGFDYALSVANEYHAHLTVVHVLEGISRLHSTESSAKAETCLASLVGAHHVDGANITPLVRAGRAYREIAQLACERQADLVIMAVRGRNALDDRVFGSTTYRVLQLGNSPVLAIHG